MSAKLVNSGGEICVQFPCDRCGKNMLASLEGLGGLFKCGECGSATYMPSVPCHRAGCGGTYRRCGGVIQVLPVAPDELARRQAEADGEIEALGPGTPTDDYREEVGEIRARIEWEITRYRCSGCGEGHSWAAGRAHGYESGTAKCARIVCGDCRRPPSADELPQPDSIFNQPLERTYDYLWLDTVDARVQAAAPAQIVVAIGGREPSERQILACELAEKIDQAFWTGMLRGLVDRGLTSVRLVIAGETGGLAAALAEVLPAAVVQRSRSAFLRDILQEVPAAERRELRASLKSIFAQASRDAARVQLELVSSGLEPVAPDAARLLRAGGDEALAFMAFPRRHWARIASLDDFKPLNERILGRLYASPKAALSNAKADCIRLYAA